jgi:hypothetical protein
MKHNYNFLILYSDIKWKIRPKTEEAYTNKPSFAAVQFHLEPTLPQQ